MKTLPVTPSHRHSYHQNAEAGSAILAVIIVTFIASAVAASLLRLGLHEQRLNHRHFTNLQVRNATESVIELGMAQLQHRWQTQTNFTNNELSPDINPLTIPQSFQDHWDYEGSRVNNSSFELFGGVIPENTVRLYVDPDDPANQFDPQRGNRILVRDVNIYAKVESTSMGGHVQSAYAIQRFQLRDAPLFSYAVFYNMDLEFHPGPQMTMSGPVHANGNIWVVAKSDLVFNGLVTTSGNFHVGMMRTPYQTNWSGFSGESDQTGTKVWIRNDRNSGTQFDGLYYSNPYKGSGPTNRSSSYWDSRSYHSIDANGNVTHNDFGSSGFTTWREFASERWRGNLQTGSHNTPKLNPVGFQDYVADHDNPSGQALNYGYAIIEPTMPAIDPANPGFVNPFHKGAAETEKFAHKAGLTVRIHYDDGSTPIPAHAQPILTYHNNPQHGSRQETGYYVSLHKISRTNPHDHSSTNYTSHALPRKLPDGSVELDSNGNPVLYTVNEVQYEDVELNHTHLKRIFAARPYSETTSHGNTTVTSGMKEQRLNVTMDLIEMNIGNLKSVLEQGQGVHGIWQHQGGHSTYNPSDEFNGIIYVEFPTQADPNREDRIVTATSTMRGSHYPGLLLSNATAIPNPSYNQTSGRDAGFTLATNQSMYVKGHYNADGNINTGNSTSSDNSLSPDPPAALAADAITMLSDNFNFTASHLSKNDGKASFTEFNAAVITGLTPTNKGGQAVSSGGNHNLIRFLEDWSNVTFRYRGSMVALYESEVATGGYTGSCFSPPNRQWGFFNQFANGIYPPGTPNVRSFRKLGFRFLSAQEYQQAINALQTSGWTNQG